MVSVPVVPGIDISFTNVVAVDVVPVTSFSAVHVVCVIIIVGVEVVGTFTPEQVVDTVSAINGVRVPSSPP